MDALLIIGAIVMFVLMFVCMGKEKKLSGFYSEIGVCGRWYAFFTVYSLFAGVVSTVGAVVGIVMGVMGKVLWSDVLIALGIAVICLLVGVFMYKRAYNKCPEGLKKRFWFDIIVMMLGATLRISFFFVVLMFKTWFVTNPPVTYTTDDGRTLYGYPFSNDVYDTFGNRVGYKTGDGKVVFD